MSDTMASFASLRDGFGSKMNQLRRRFSQGEMQGDEDADAQQQSLPASAAPGLSNPSAQSASSVAAAGGPNQNVMHSSQATSSTMQHQQQRDRPNMSLNFTSSSSSPSPGTTGHPNLPSRDSAAYQQQQQQMRYQQQQQQQQQAQQQQQSQLPKTTSAPSSPNKNYTPANIARSFFRQVSQSTTNLVQQTVAAAGSVTGSREKNKILLVIDDQHTDWSKYFRGRRIQNEWDIRIEQAEFNEINMAATSDRGLAVDMEIMRGGTKVVRSFRPDFVLIRQPIRDANRDYRHFILALMYSNIPSVNSLESLYMFLDKPIIFSQLIQIQQRLGKEKFPLIHQSFYPNHREMLTSTQFPVVIKIGHCHGGLGKTRVDNHYDFQDVVSLVGSCGSYCTVEPFVDSKYDLHLQKVGPSYKAFIRKSISGSWKANIGSSMLEQVPLQEKFRMWLDECSRVFGGLDVFAIEAVVGKDGQEHIIGINDSSTMGLLGETQEEDRQLIAEIVYRKMDADANRRRYSMQTTPGQPMEQQRGPTPSSGQTPGSGYTGAPTIPNGIPPRRESLGQSGAPAGPSREQTTPSGRPASQIGPPPGGYSRDPPIRDPRDSNIRDVSSREPPSRDSSSAPGAPLSRRESDSRTSTFNPAGPSGAGGFGQQGFSSGGTAGAGPSSTERQPMPGATSGVGIPPGMGRPGMGPPSGHPPYQGAGQQPVGMNRPPQAGSTDTDDTMSNLKRTFAGIFGDM
ncbi:synapsin-like [Paramacrobiotus metropolitanus]|uniref:synapsin-like n=1 Tax=Paramacrobiotus metropolitanus TaxID=2943436 RepID=UPI002445A938|nr:synapsin-like [Paramacrobiotus metropolitanus]